MQYIAETLHVCNVKKFMMYCMFNQEIVHVLVTIVNLYHKSTFDLILGLPESKLSLCCHSVAVVLTLCMSSFVLVKLYSIPSFFSPQ